MLCWSLWKAHQSLTVGALQSLGMGLGTEPTCAEYTLHSTSEEQDTKLLVLPQLGQSFQQLQRMLSQVRYLPACPRPQPGAPLSYLADEDFPQGVTGMRSVHENLSDSCRAQGGLK